MYKLILPPITKTQKYFIFLLYKFRFLTINQPQQLLHHKDSHRIREWLTDLKDKGYTSVIVDKKNPTKRHIFCLDTKAKYILREDEDCDKKVLGRLHKEKGLGEKFINHLLFIFDIYLYFLSRKEKDSKLHFLTRRDLLGYDFFPDELPDAYLAVESKRQIDKYFLELFDGDRDRPGIIRYAFRKYIKYSENGSWQANSNNSPFPSILFVLSGERRKQFALHYGNAKLKKSFEDISIYVTTKNNIQFAGKNINIWQKVNKYPE